MKTKEERNSFSTAFFSLWLIKLENFARVHTDTHTHINFNESQFEENFLVRKRTCVKHGHIEREETKNNFDHFRRRQNK